MTTDTFDCTGLLRSDLPPASAKWEGFPRYNFIGGHNDAASVPVDDLVAAAVSVLRREGRTLATYGLDSGPQGHRGLREFLVKKLARDAGIRCSADEILITSGSLQGLDLVNEILVGPGDTVIVEQSTYGGAISRLNRIGAKIVGIPVDGDGLDTRALARALDDLRSQGVTPKYIYTIPTVQNPTATVMTPARRTELIELSRAHGVPIFEDECYSDLVWDGKRPPALRAMDPGACAIHIGSFSKSIAPALRVGFLVASWPLMGHILSIKSDAGSGALEQMILAEYCEAHFDAHVRALRETLRGKLDALVAALKTQFGETAQFDYPAGGIFLWVTLPDQVDTSRLQQLAARAGISINPGAEWMTDAVAGKRRLRLCFAHPTEDVIREGVTQLAEVCRREFGVPAGPDATHR
ncbi:MAG: aminotransferase class I/II-fold pyridoxal phosphate-dependent enzyme [Betaproteobacteria bacterium]|nr:aminotransferase class I/II-fold pyridoxal phosphate-dependent enzyme [Betaproteobacteria bacterium]